MPFTTQPPRSQYDRNISFLLKGNGPDVSLTLPINPDEFDTSTPARVTTTQTLQGVYQDFGGIGVQTIRYQGNTGWRRRYLSENMDGFEVFKKLYEDFYLEYHRRVSTAIDPNDVQCMVIDDLYDKVYIVSMDDFQASKSKSKPLIYNYTIPMTVQNTDTNTRTPVDLSDLSLPSVGLDENQIPIAFSDLLARSGTWDIRTFRQYTVVSGDNIKLISFLYFGTSARDVDIALMNNLTPPYIFNAGTILTIPW